MPRLGIADRIADLAQRVRLALDDWWARARLGRELADLENRHVLDATLTDVGLSRAQVPALVRGFPQRQRQFRRMLTRLGIPPSRIAGRDALNDLIWTCTICTVDKRCRAWLDTGRTRGYAAFCPNAAAFDQLRQPRRRPAPARALASGARR
jgi:uncharacterized protein YjiS (DUF1127 family)